VVLNAAAAIYVGGAATSFGEGVRAASISIDSGKALRALAALREASGGTVMVLAKGY
jgi:anthranilate phosphoribosyltransferase